MKSLNKITKENIEDIMALTAMQEGILFQYLLNPNCKNYFEQLSIHLTGKIDVQSLIQAWQFVIETNEMLRTVFRWEKLKKPIQIILKEHKLDFFEHNLIGKNPNEQKRLLNEIKVNDRKRGFDLEFEPAFRVILVHLTYSECELIVSNHHILYDGWSTGVIIKEFFEAYSILVKGEEIKTCIKTKFKEYLKWSQKIEKDEQKKYWSEYMSGFEVKTSLPIDNEKSAESSSVATYIERLPEKVAGLVDDMVKRERVTVNSFLLAIWGILLQRYNNSNDIIFGSTISGRPAEFPGIETLVGLFINTLPVRLHAEGTLRFNDLLTDLNQSLQARKMSTLLTPLNEIKSYSSMETKGNMFDSLVVMENYPLKDLLSGIQYQVQANGFSTFSATNYDLVLAFMVFDGIELHLGFDPSRFQQKTIQRLVKHFFNIIQEVVLNSCKPLHEIEMLSEDERYQLIKTFNTTSQEFRYKGTIQEVFEQKAIEQRDQVAVLCANKVMTFGELNAKANQLARTLRKKGVIPDQIVSILTERSVKLIIGIFAIIKAGGAYLPLDPENPVERTEFILKDSGTELLLFYDQKIDKFHFTGQKVDLADEQNYDTDFSDLQLVNKSNDLVYCIYTSGSTGNPKGVIIEHASVVNILQALQQIYPMCFGDTYLLKTTAVFDVSVSEIFGWFWGSGRLAILDPGGEKDPKVIVRAINDYSVTHINFVPTMLAVFLDTLEPSDIKIARQLKYCFVAGEAISTSLVEKFNQLFPNVQLENLYGPTETTIYVTKYSLEHKLLYKRVPIGKIFPNIQVYIVDQNTNLQPIGVAGELCVAGSGLARGYLNRPELMSEKFIDNPFELGTKIYKTGDIAKWLPDGNIEYLGRNDHQVKVRGFRVELGEIEEKILRITSIESVVVINKIDSSEMNYLVAYFIAKYPIDSTELQEILSKELPPYMIPTYFIQVDEMPLTSSGKLDRKSFPEVNQVSKKRDDFCLPSTDIEIRLAQIWSAVLEVDGIGLDSNFYKSGGHSLKAIQMVSRIQKEFKISLELKEFFTHPTLYELARAIETSQNNRLDFNDILLQQEAEYYELSFAQKGMWILDQREKNNSAYIISHVHTFTNELVDHKALEKACQTLINRHESLRTNIILVAGEPKQKIHQKREFKLKFLDLQKKADAVDLAAFEATQIATTPFDLANDLLFRVTLVLLNSKQYQLLLAFHHIIADGWSMDIFQRELSILYEGYKSGQIRSLNPLTVQYKDFVFWQNNMIKEGRMDSLRQNLLNKLQNSLVTLHLPYDAPYHQELHNREGSAYQVLLPRKLEKALEHLAQSKDVPLSTILLASFSVYLSRLTGEKDVIFIGPITGRNHVNFQNTIGLFINTALYLNEVCWNETFESFIEKVQSNLLKILDAQMYPFELLAEDLALIQKQNQPQVTSISFNILNFAHNQNPQTGKLPLGHFRLAQQMKYDLGCYIAKTEQGITLKYEYRSVLFKKKTIQYMIEELVNFLNQIGENCKKLIKAYGLFSKERALLQDDSIVLEVPYVKFSREDIDQSIPQRFEKVIQLYPNKVAMRIGDVKLSYKELNLRANQVASYLSNQGKEQDVKDSQPTVALLFEHGIDMVIAMFGALKSGYIYVPLDPTYPTERLKQIVVDAKPDFLITHFTDQDVESLFGNQISSEQIVKLKDLKFNTAWKKPKNYSDPDQIAYILYTSGTTGSPKGVFQTHRNVLHFIQNYTNKLHISEKDRLTLLSSYCFDASVMDIYGALLNGATLYPYNIKTIGNLTDLTMWLAKQQITIYHSVPTVFRYLANFLSNKDKFANLRLIVLGGEILIQKDIQMFQKHFGSDTILVNSYGPTESTVTLLQMMNRDTDVTSQAVPVGYPVGETEVLLVDESGEEVPVFSVGEIVIKSKYLALGYWNMLEQTSKVFQVDSESGSERLYWSGDLGYRLADSSICVIGRKDSQVKVRGYRIELTEIEMVLDHIDGVQKSAVLAHLQDNHELQLVAYYVLQADCQLDVEILKRELETRLPEYMQPDQLIRIDKMPVTLTGKINRGELFSVAEEIHSQVKNKSAQILPQEVNKIEAQLMDIWAEILGKKSTGIDDNFFQLGGHSLKALVLVSMIHQKMDVEVPLSEVFNRPRLKDLANYIQDAQKDIYSCIPVVEDRPYYETSPAQKRLYMLQQLDVTSTSYNISTVFKVRGDLNLQRLENAFRSIIRRHEILRTNFHVLDDQIIQKIHQHVDFRIELIANINGSQKTIEQEFQEFVKPFDLGKETLLRVGVLKIEDDDYIIICDIHHIVFDGYSSGILINEIAKLYQYEELQPLAIQYKDFSLWQNNLLNSKRMKKQENFWLNLLSDEFSKLNIPTDYVRPILKSFIGKSVSFSTNKELTAELKKLVHNTNTTLYMVLLASINILLNKYSGQEDILIGSPIVGRNHVDLQGLIGMFVNTIVMRNYPEFNKSFSDFLQEVKENALKAYENQDYQFEKLVEKLNLPVDTSRNILFDVMFTLQNVENKQPEINGLDFSQCVFDKTTSKFDLSFVANELDDCIIFYLEYNTKLFKQKTINRFAKHLVNILKQVVANKEITLGSIQLLTQQEKDQILVDFNNTAVNYHSKKTIQELFEEQVSKTPNEVAILHNKLALTYQDLNNKANQLAKKLRDLAVKKNHIVGIIAEPSLEMVISLVAILKSGGAYVPIDPHYPVERIEYILNDVNAEILLAQQHLMNLVSPKGSVINLNDSGLYTGESSNLSVINQNSDLAYIIYTSGSTGQPKGVMVEHRNVTNVLTWFGEKYELKPGIRVMQMTNYTFDPSVEQIFGTLLYGATIYLSDRNLLADSTKVRKFINDNQIQIINFVPSVLNEILGSCETKLKSLEVVISGGEKLDENLKNQILEKNYKLYNHYGPTETTIDAITEKCTDGKVVLGKPISNIKCYILNSQKQLLSVGMVGELWISGVGVTRGYLNDPELTAVKFVDNPFQSGEKMFKTGDFARWLSDGRIEFLGRTDQMVKIRGFRIELFEIECRLLKHDSVKEAIVLARKDDNFSNYICAYLVLAKETSSRNLRKFLAQSLPEYMIPSYFVLLQELPKNSNGKIDKTLLPEPKENMILESEYKPAQNETEQKLVKIWEEALDKDNIGINDNFFELGGHSLKATLLISKIRKNFGVEMPLMQIFQTPTIEELGKLIQNSSKTRYESIKNVEEKKYYEVSSAQKRMYLLQNYDLNSVRYNISGVLKVEGKIKVKMIEEIFKKIIVRHESLRTSFTMMEEVLTQKINNEVDFKVECLKKQHQTLDHIIKEFIRPFELSKAPLLRVGVVQLEEDVHIIILDVHHIVSDGISIGILVSEFVRLYHGRELKDLKFQYKDYSEWQNRLLKTALIKNQENYWLNRFNDEIPVLNLPTDYQRPAVQSFAGDRISIQLVPKLSRGLKKIAKNTNSTLYMVLLSAIHILLSKYSGQEDLIVGSPIAGRPHEDLKGIVGMFVNTLAMRNNSHGNLTYIEFLNEVKENVLMAFENQDYQFEALVDKLNFSRDLRRNPLFDVMFVMQNLDNQQLEFTDLKINRYNYQSETTKFDLTITASGVEHIYLTFEYSIQLFKRETVDMMILHFIKLVDEIITNSQIKINNIEIITNEEKDFLLNQLNDTYTDYPRTKTISQLFEESSDLFPDKLAVIFREKALTYNELNEKANSLAWILQKKGVTKETRVGIVSEESIEMIIGILAILKAGGAYVPIDPEYPDARVNLILDDCSINIFLIHGKFRKNSDIKCKKIDLLNTQLYSGRKENLKPVNSSQSLAYVIYTSGSTGKPKGVMVEHRSVVRLTKNANYFNFTHDDKLLQTASLVFDVSIFEIWGSLLNGAELHLCSTDLLLDLIILEKYIQKNHINILWLTTSLFNLIADENPYLFRSLKYLLIGGEALSPKHVNKVRRECKSLKIINGYGPTENTTFSTYFYIDKKYSSNIPIGKPISNSTCYIVDRYNKICPLGVYGELCVGGDGLGRGYVNHPELTADKFRKFPFLPGERLYRTGDRVRWLFNGNMEFLGRIDQQVKIRGFRIEPSEIESILIQYDKIKEAVIDVKKDERETKYLCAFVVAKNEVTTRELREYLAKSLPDYMIPLYFVFLDKMPLNINGKIDRKLLVEPKDRISMSSNYKTAENEIEERLEILWADLLKLDQIGVDKNFFELGGHSLLASKLIFKINEIFCIKLSLKELYSTPTISGLAKQIEKVLKCKSKKVDLKKINQELQQKFNISSKLIKYQVAKRNYFVLYTDKLGDQICNYLREQYSTDFLPHYIRGFTHEVEQLSYEIVQSPSMFSKTLNLQPVESTQDIDSYQDFIETQNNVLHTQITSNQILDKYSCGSVQTRYLVSGFNSMITTDLFLQNISLEFIHERLLSLINTQPLLRSVIIREGRFKFVEYDKIKSVSFPVIDCSGYNIDETYQIIKQLKYYLKSSSRTMQLQCNLLYKIIIVKLNNKDYHFLFSINHLLSDIETRRIINHYFSPYVKIEENQKMASYKEFLLDMKTINTLEKVRDFKKTSIFLDFKTQVEHIQKKYGVGEKVLFSDPYCLEVELRGSGEDNFLIGIVAYVSSNLCKIAFDLDVIPFKYFVNRHIHGKNSYYYTIGDFHDFIPVLVDVNNIGSPQECNDLLFKFDKWIVDEKLYFGILSSDHEISKYVRKCPITLNHVGEISIQEENDLLKSKLNSFDYITYPINSFSVGNKVKILFLHGLPINKIAKVCQFMISIGIKYKLTKL